MRRQLPGTSPISAGALARALAAPVTVPDALARLRELLRARFEASDVRLYGSGTQALQASLRTAVDATGGAVALPGYSCFDMATAAVGSGAPLAFYDVDPRTLAPDPGSLEEALRAGATVVVAGNLYGLPLDWDVLGDLATRYGAILVEDAAQGVGSRWNGRPGGTFGDLTVLSFGRGKGWTGGGGGALLGRGDRVSLPPAPDRSASGSRSLAVGLAQWTLGRPGLFGLAHAVPGLHLGETLYHDPGPLVRIARASAALILSTEDAARHEVAARRVRAAAWRDDLPDRLSETLPSPVQGGVSADLRFPFLAPPGDAARRSILKRVQRFGAAPGYPAVLRDIPAVAPTVAGSQQRFLDGAETLVSRLVTLPTHTFVTDREVSEATAILREIARE